MKHEFGRFSELFEEPLINGLNRPTRVRGSGYKTVNMGEIFAHDRTDNIDMELVDSEPGPILKGWRVVTIGELCTLEYGKSLVSYTRHHGKFPVMGSNGQLGWHKEPFAKGPGVVVGRKGNLGTVKWVHSDYYPIDTTYFVRQTSDNVPITYVYYCLLQAKLESHSTDSAFSGLNRTLANSLKTIMPDTKHMATFVEIVQFNNVLIRNNRDKIKNTLVAIT